MVKKTGRAGGTDMSPAEEGTTTTTRRTQADITTKKTKNLQRRWNQSKGTKLIRISSKGGWHKICKQSSEFWRGKINQNVEKWKKLTSDSWVINSLGVKVELYDMNIPDKKKK